MTGSSSTWITSPARPKNGIVAIGLGDWAPAKTKTPEKVTSTGYYYRDALIVSKAAALLGKTDDAKKYGELASSIREAFNKEFYDPKTGLYAGGTQTAMSCALYHGLVPPEERAKVLGKLVETIQAQDGHLDAGILGTKYLIDSLTAAGRADVVYGMATKTDYPSWGRWLEQGALPFGNSGTATPRAITSCSGTSAPGSTRPWPASTRTSRPWVSSISSSNRNCWAT